MRTTPGKLQKTNKSWQGASVSAVDFGKFLPMKPICPEDPFLSSSVLGSNPVPLTSTTVTEVGNCAVIGLGWQRKSVSPADGKPLTCAGHTGLRPSPGSTAETQRPACPAVAVETQPCSKVLMSSGPQVQWPWKSPLRAQILAAEP